MPILAEIILLAKNVENPPSFAPGFPGALIAWWVCNRTKRNAFGGWLLFYYWQMYGGLLMTALFFTLNLQSYVPENFTDRGKYYLFLASTVPVLVLLLAKTVVGTLLFSVQRWDLLRLLRWIIAAEIAMSVTAMVIDSVNLPDNVGLHVLTIVPESIWLAYLYRSVRVKHVFHSHDWEEAVETIYPLKPQTLLGG